MYRLDSDKIFSLVMKVCGCSAGVLVLLILLFIGFEAGPALGLGMEKFFIDTIWDPSTSQYNLMPMVIGSLLVTFGALLLALPLGFFAAIFCEYTLSNHYGFLLRSLIEILAGIPSVIYGFWGIVAIIPILYHLSPPGANILAGCIVLAAMILPTLAILFMNAIRSIPQSWVLGSDALGLSSTTTVFAIILPGIKQQMGIAVLVALGRALGETMAVLMVCGNIVKIPLSIFDPVRTLTSNIALEMAYATNHHRAALFVSGLLLLLVVSILTLVVSWRQSRENLYVQY